MATYPTNPPGNTLAAIQQKVRRLTRSPSESQLTTDDLNNYINTFVVYDFPEHLRMFNLRTTFTFITNPFQDTYPTDTASFGWSDLSGGTTTNAPNQPLFNFQNKYISIHSPVYIAGYQSFFSQSREQFFGIYPMTNSIQSIGVTGDGLTTSFSGNVINNQNNFTNVTSSATSIQSASILQNEVLFDSVDINENGLNLVDVPVIDSVTGNPTVWGNLYPQDALPTTPPVGIAPYTFVDPAISPNAGPYNNNYINYYTGAFVITFGAAPKSGQPINSQVVTGTTTLPQALLFYDDKIVLRPIPDQPYRVQFEAYARPTRLLETTSVPALEEWWQYIALGTSRKVFQDRLDMDSVALIDPEYRKQETLCLRRTIVQYTNERTATIYTEQTGLLGSSWGGWGQTGGSF
jgi:hypothetical protein